MIQYAHLLEEQYVLLNKEIPMRRYDEELLRTLHEYIIDYQKLNGSSPTYRKIANRFPTCFSSTSKVKNYLSVLSDRGLIERA